MNREDATRYDELLICERECMDKAGDALSNGSSVGAREWFEAAEVARRLAQRIKAGPEVRGES